MLSDLLIITASSDSGSHSWKIQLKFQTRIIFCCCWRYRQTLAHHSGGKHIVYFDCGSAIDQPFYSPENSRYLVFKFQVSSKAAFRWVLVKWWPVRCRRERPDISLIKSAVDCCACNGVTTFSCKLDGSLCNLSYCSFFCVVCRQMWSLIRERAQFIRSQAEGR